LEVLRAVRSGDLRFDLVAGLTVAAVAIPQAIGYAAVAELPTQYGLYTAGVAVIAGALWGSSRHLSTGPTNATSLLVLSILLGFLPEPGLDPQRFVLAAGMLAVLAGLFRIALAYLRFGALVTLASRSVLLGFAAGAGLLIAAGQLRHVLGISAAAAPDLLTTLARIVERVDQIHLPTVLVGVACLVGILLLQLIGRRVPAMILVVVAGALGVWALGLDRMGVELVGEIPRSLPLPTLLAIDTLPDWDMVRKLVLGSMALAALGLIESMASAQTLAQQTGQPLDNNQEFFGQGMANLWAGFFSGYPASGSLTRSALNLRAGARTQMSSVFCGLAIFAAMLLFAPWARWIPRSAVAAVLFVVAWGMIDRRAIRRVIHTSRVEAAIMVATFGSTLLLPLEFAVMGGVVLSLAYFVIRSSLPRVYQVVPDPTFRHFVENPSLPVCPQLGVINIRGPLFFGAVYHVEEALRNNLELYPGQYCLVLRMHGVDLIDLTGIEMLESVVHQHRQIGGDVFLIRLRRPVAEVMEDSGFLDLLGPDHVLPQEGAIEQIFDQIIDPSVCVFECPHRVFAECQAIDKHPLSEALPAPVCHEIEPGRLLGVDEALAWMQSCRPLLVDLREEPEVAKGHLPDVHWVPLSQLLRRASELPRDRPLLLICRSGRRTLRAIRMLSDLGFENLYGLRGGQLAWMAAGHPMTRGPAGVAPGEQPGTS
jgi:SulP family sulfate permease